MQLVGRDTAQVMSEENVEVVRQAIDAANRSDRARAEQLLHPDVEWSTVLRPVLGVETVSGRDAVLRFGFEDIPDAIEDFHAEVEELKDLGEGRVLLVARYLGRGKSSGIELEERISSIHTVRDRMIVSVRDYPGRQEALEAAGLSE
jgi:ketosteroid isomerase-like protein